MKMVFRVGGLVLAMAALLGLGRLWAESKQKKPAPPRTRMALVNLSYVLKNYTRYKHFQEDVRSSVKPFEDRDKKLRGQLEKLMAQLKKQREDAAIVPAKAEDIEEKAKKLQREIEDNQIKARRALSKKNEEDMRTLFQDVERAAKRYAAAHDIDVVLHYNDAATQEEYYSPQNIARKLNSGALMPLYCVSGINISKKLVPLMNQRVRDE